MDELQQKAQKIIEKVDVSTLSARIADIEAQSTDSAFWQDHQKAATLMKELSDLQARKEQLEFLELALSENDEQTARKLVKELESVFYFSGPHDESSAILSIHAGQGGTEAMDWVSMLYRMYTKYFSSKGFSTELIDQTAGEEAGLKSVTIEVNGKRAYGLLKWESGVHRLVRQSPFNADNLRQTSFALVEVLPQIESDEGVEIKEDDLDWEFYRASSHGGQNVQKVSTAVRLTHIPTGIIVTCQTERFQAQNREYALKLLKAKLWIRYEEEKRHEQKMLKGEYKMPGWGNQIRSYVLHPYKMVKDLRTEYETSQAEWVLDGNLDDFIDEELRILSNEKSTLDN